MDTYLSVKRGLTAFLLTAISVVVFSMNVNCSEKPAVNIPGPERIIPDNMVAAAPLAKSAGEVTYAGQVQTKDGGIVSVNLVIKQPLTPGKEGAVLKYGGKRMCECHGTFEGEKDNKKIFSLMSQNGGKFCDKLENLEVNLGSHDSREVSYIASSGDKTTTEEGKLTKTK